MSAERDTDAAKMALEAMQAEAERDGLAVELKAAHERLAGFALVQAAYEQLIGKLQASIKQFREDVEHLGAQLGQLQPREVCPVCGKPYANVKEAVSPLASWNNMQRCWVAAEECWKAARNPSDGGH